jgi:small multidrug resistance pump
MSWLFLFLAILAEVAGTTCMKLSVSFTQILPSILMVVFYAVSLGSLTIAIGGIEVSVAYAIWSGLGTVLITTIGIFWFRETSSLLKMVSIGLVITGVIGLNASGTRH